MKERPILFSAPMVRAILDGRKTQTRRVMEPQPEVLHWQDIAAMHGRSSDGVPFGDPYRWRIVGPDYPDSAEDDVCSPYAAGDLLWVREAWAAPHAYDHRPPRLIPQDARIHCASTEDRGGLLWRPSTHMPRWASRITLEIADVRVQRLQDISEADAIAEGLARHGDGWRGAPDLPWFASPTGAYRSLWELIHPRAGSWDLNPWVWALTFRRIEQHACAA